MNYAELIKEKESLIRDLRLQENFLREDIQVLMEQQQADERDLHTGDTVIYEGKKGILTGFVNGVWRWKAFKKDGTPEKCEHRTYEWSGRKIEKVEAK